MRWQITFVVLCLMAAALLVPTVHAADLLFRLTHGDQHSLVLGTVVSVSDSTVRLDVETIISGQFLPSVISVQIPGAFTEAASHIKLEPRDYAVFSLDKKADQYTIAWGFFEVSSLDIATLEVIQGPLLRGDLAAFQWYINSRGTENDFYFIGTSAYVRHADGTETQIYPPTTEPAEAKPGPDAVKTPIDKAESPSGPSESLVSAAKAASETIPQDEKVFVPQWGHVIIVVGFVWVIYFAYRLWSR